MSADRGEEGAGAEQGGRGGGELGGMPALAHSLRVLHLRGFQVGVLVLSGGGVER